MMRTIFAALLIAVCNAHHFYVTDNSTQQTCIIIDADFVFDLVFVAENNTEKFQAEMLNVTSVEGNCQEFIPEKNLTAQTLKIKFYADEVTALQAKEWELDLVFGTSSSKAFELVDYTLKTQKTPHIKYFGTFARDEKTAGDVAGSGVDAYKCSKSFLGLVGGSQITMSSSNVIAFANINGTTFPSGQAYEVCERDSRTNTIVPIIVGACLAALVIVVLVGYLIGRARAKRQGYASV